MLKVSRGRAGWSEQEDALLFEEIEGSRSSGRPLKAVFEAVAEKTGRKPNSIRNYYYARIKERDLSSSALHAGAFVPFTGEEIQTLLRTVLSAQANGISVRACTMSMGEGDTRAMLRYQNKYRSLLKNQPELVRKAAEELKAEGVEFDPYAARRAKPRRGEQAATVYDKLSRVKGIEAGSILRGLERMAELAARAQEQEGQTADLISAIRVLKERVERQEQELIQEQRRFHELLMMYRSLAGREGESLLALAGEGQGDYQA